MAASSPTIIPTLSTSRLSKTPVSCSSSPSLTAFNVFPSALRPLVLHTKKNRHSEVLANAQQTFEFSGGSLFDSEFEDDDEPPSTPGWGIPDIEDREEPQCPPGLRQYETMTVLRPDMSENERLALIQKYEELLVAGGGVYVEVFNRGIVPLAYGIKKKNKAGETNIYFDGIYILFTYFTKPESLEELKEMLNADDDVIRSTSFKIRKRKY
ncbi:unnamed protein product [Cuscuta epithymum]|uniref:Plastid ribosomal protein S6 n=1 Tax=Cuscuta epithymum TaxID=186058 RepID=A0AAV0ENM8_9ASTE|nr:unnamed protein product [Cuscuta epithymum]